MKSLFLLGSIVMHALFIIHAFSPTKNNSRLGVGRRRLLVNVANTEASPSSSNQQEEYAFFDQATISVRAGSGGQGASTYKLTATGQKGPPDGGNGGRGGHVIIEVDHSLNTLAGLSNAWRPNAYGGSGAATTQRPSRPRLFRAENGSNGERQGKSGRYGRDSVIKVPPGTIVIEQLANGETVELASLTAESSPLLVARGGQGGEGTAVLLRGGRGVQRPRLSAEGGERKMLELTLKIVADVALVGKPNAGKSTLLAAVTRAKPKISNYPFTTVIPNLGVWLPPSSDYVADDESSGSGSDGLVLCDVPGLIAGAAEGVGLGHAFLRHVERCHVILHLVDATAEDPLSDYAMINQEIVKYGTGHLAAMPQVVVVNKIDALEQEDAMSGLKAKFSREELEERLRTAMPHTRLMWMSAKEKDGVDDLMIRLAAFVKKVKEATA